MLHLKCHTGILTGASNPFFFILFFDYQELRLYGYVALTTNDLMRESSASFQASPDGVLIAPHPSP